MRRIFFSIFTIFSVLIAETTISGVGFFNYTYDATKDSDNDDGFSLNRVYFTYKNNISDDLSIKFQTDVGEVGDDERLTSYLKKAQVDWKSPIGKLVFGMQGMNMFNITEKTWGFRFIEKSPMDLHKLSSSADLGVGFSNKVGDFSYSMLVTNGTGYKKQENDEFKKYSFSAVYGQPKLVKKDGYNVGIAYSMEPYEDANEETYNESVMSFFGGYAANGLRVGGEFDMETNSETDIIRQIMALYASYKIKDNLEGLVYVDMYDPNTDSNDDASTYIIAGFNYYVEGGLVLTPNMRMINPEDGSDSSMMYKLNLRFKF